MKHEMPALTEQKREELIAAAKEFLQMHDGALGDLIDISLAALTAEPSAYKWEGKKSGSTCFDGIKPLGVTSHPLYNSPPVPAMKQIELPNGFNPGIGDIFDKTAPVMRRDASDGKWLHKADVAKILRGLGYEVKE